MHWRHDSSCRALIYIYIYIYIYICISMDSSRLGTGMLLIKPQVTQVRIKATRIGLVLFSVLCISQTLFGSFEHLKPVSDLRLANKMAFLVLVAVCTFGGHLSIWTIYEWKQQFPKLAIEICIGQLFICCYNALSQFFLINRNKRRKGTCLLLGYLLSNQV